MVEEINRLIGTSIMSFQDLAGKAIGVGQEVSNTAFGVAKGALGDSTETQPDNYKVSQEGDYRFVVRLREKPIKGLSIIGEENDASVAKSLPKPEAGVHYAHWSNDKLGIDMNVDTVNSTLLVVITVSGISTGCIPGRLSTSTSMYGLGIGIDLEKVSGDCKFLSDIDKREIRAILNLSVDGKEMREDFKICVW